MKFKPLVLALTIAALMAAVGQTSRAFSLKELLGIEEEGATEEQTGGGLMEETGAEAPAVGVETGPNWGKPSGTITKTPYDLAVLQRVLENADGNQRAAVLADEETFKRFVQRETDAASLLQAARANNLQQDPDVTFLMQRGSENILREIYLNRLVGSKIPAGFPTEEQMKQYFEQNKAKLVIPERVQAWQIFFAYEKNADAKSRAAVSQKADSVARDLAQDKVTFAEAAQKYSAHEASRQRGGDMGSVSVDDLKPEIKQALLALPEGQVSSPLKTDAGVHIVKRGARTAAQPLEYEAIKDQIRPLMVKQAKLQLRNAIVEQARKTYPVEVDAKKVEELRLRLRTDMAPAGGKGAAAKKSGA